MGEFFLTFPNFIFYEQRWKICVGTIFWRTLRIIFHFNFQWFICPFIFKVECHQNCQFYLTMMNGLHLEVIIIIKKQKKNIREIIPVFTIIK